jgi:hypothetical protein
MYMTQPYKLSDSDLDRLTLLAQTVDLSPGPGGSRITEAEVLRAPVHQLGLPLGEITKIAVVALYPSSQIVAHRDFWEQGTRFHLPLVQNEFCWSFSGDCWQHLELGQLYAVDPAVWHGAVNWGPTRRLHMMVDTK